MKEFIMQETEEMTTFGSVWKCYEPVAEIVRCKDCIYGDDFDCPAPLPTGYLCQKGHGSHTGEWFCADGGKR
jgi:hypothetical protein